MTDPTSDPVWSRWALPHEQVTQWAVADTDNSGARVPRAHCVEVGSGLYDLMLTTLLRDGVGFTLSADLPGHVPTLLFNIDLGEGSVMSRGGGTYALDVAQALDDLEVAQACPVTRSEALVLALRADLRRVGADEGLAYADVCLPPTSGAASHDVVRWRIEWSRDRRRMVATIPYTLRALSDPSMPPVPS